MPVKRWFCIFACSAVFAALLFAGFNALVDPFGIFGDPVFNWWSYDMTQNPRTAKIGWLDKNSYKYDSYIIGCSKTSAFSAELLSRYSGANFYNMTMYGGDLYDSEMTIKYILDNYGAKNIIVNTGLSELMYFNEEDDPIKGNLHAKVDGSSLLAFYGRYLFAHPQYSADKIRAYIGQSYLVNPSKVFIPETGEYDKSLRDVEPIGSLENYLARYPEFLDENQPLGGLGAVMPCVESVERMKRMCQGAGASFTFIVSPMYGCDLDIYCNGDLFGFFRQLSAVTDFWDFSGYHSVASEPRYFYDTMHCRNSVGAMMIARVYGDLGAYVPDDFGVYVTAGNVEGRIAAYSGVGHDAPARDIGLPVLMYHNVSDAAYSGSACTPELFRGQMEALKAAGYATVTFADVIDYVERGAALPDKPIIVTFDDGYAENLTVAAPILQELGMRAEINVIGVSAGKDTYKDTGAPITPHFSMEDALPWAQAGIIEIGSHSYDMHQVPEFDGDNCRKGVYISAGESEDEYVSAFRSDFQKSADGVEDVLGDPVVVYAYPYGYYSDLTEVLLAEMGIKVTLTVDEGINTVVAGLPQSLRAMKRCNISDEIAPDEIVDYLKGKDLND
jgi:peptidoglycan/xylan/chitin deacetylase (PgdA/CDA1 family)